MGPHVWFVSQVLLGATVATCSHVISCWESRQVKSAELKSVPSAPSPAQPWALQAYVLWLPHHSQGQSS